MATSEARKQDYLSTIAGWCRNGVEKRLGGGLSLSPSGMGRLSNIAGWLYGVASTSEENHEMAEKLAQDLIEWLEYLQGYGGTHDIEGGREVPEWKVVLYDDRTFNGFSVLWYRRITDGSAPHPDLKDLTEDVAVWDGMTIVRRELVGYAFSHNGGLLYHGPGKHETFAIRLGSSRFWSIHT